MAVWTFWRVSSLTKGLSFRTRDTVPTPTPARLATSRMATAAKTLSCRNRLDSSLEPVPQKNYTRKGRDCQRFAKPHGSDAISYRQPDSPPLSTANYCRTLRSNPRRLFVGAKYLTEYVGDLAQRGISANGVEDVGHGVVRSGGRRSQRRKRLRHALAVAPFPQPL